MPREGTLTRAVTRQECSWLDEDLPKGKKVFEFNGATYGCIGSGIAVSDEPNKNPFYEVPRDAVTFTPASLFTAL